MRSVFLSASIPTPDNSHYATANPFLIQFAVREFLTVCLGRRRVIWGGHPAITPMVWAVCEDLGVNYADAVHLYQSMWFKKDFPKENQQFGNVTLVEAGDDKVASLALLRKAMFSEDFEAAVFIGGMEGVREEFELFRESNPLAKLIVLRSPGGAASTLLDDAADGVDFGRILGRALGIRQIDPRERPGKRPKP